MTTALDSRIAVVTGGAGAIGTAITKALQEAGHRTVVLDRDADIACDLGSEASTRAAAAMQSKATAKAARNQHIHACPWSIGSAVLRSRESS